MKRLDPFKIRRGGVKEAIESAKRAFGTPVEASQHLGGKIELKWHFYDERLLEYNMEIGFQEESDSVSVSLTIEDTKVDQTIWGAVLKGVPPTRRLIEFVSEVKKPWAEWDDEEIMESLTWIALYNEEMGKSTSEMHNRMVLESFSRPEDPWVKRYFNNKK